MNNSLNIYDPLFWLYSDNYRTYNIEVARRLNSINAAIILSELASRRKSLSKENSLYTDPNHGPGWFYYTHDYLQERTFLTRREQDTAIGILIKFGLIEKKQLNVPAKRYFRLNEDAVLEFFGLQPRLYKSNNQDCETSPTSSLLYKEQKKQTEDIIGSSQASLPPQAGPLITSKRKQKVIEAKKEVAPRVFLSPSQESALLKKCKGDSLLLQKIYDELSDWKIGKEMEGGNDYLLLCKWQITKDTTLTKRTFASSPQQNNHLDNEEANRQQAKRIIREYYKIAKAKDIILDDFGSYLSIGNDRLYYKDLKFKELLNHYLRKTKLKEE